jgi:hypothetical protein
VRLLKPERSPPSRNVEVEESPHPEGRAGPAVEVIHRLGDGLWPLSEIAG